MKFDFENYVKDKIGNGYTASFANKVFSDFCKPGDISVKCDNNKPRVYLTKDGNDVSIGECVIEYYKDNFVFRYDYSLFEIRLFTAEGVYFAVSTADDRIIYSFFDNEAIENYNALYAKGHNQNVVVSYKGFKEYRFIPDKMYKTNQMSNDELASTAKEIINNPELIIGRTNSDELKLEKTI